MLSSNKAISNSKNRFKKTNYNKRSKTTKIDKIIVEYVIYLAFRLI